MRNLDRWLTTNLRSTVEALVRAWFQKPEPRHLPIRSRRRPLFEALEPRLLLDASLPLPVILGTPGDDNGIGGNPPAIVGTLGDDRIDALAGEDIVYAGDGNDAVVGGEGRDIALYGEAGDDLLEPGPMPLPSGGIESSNQMVDGGPGEDTLFLLGAPRDYRFTPSADGGFIVDAAGASIPEFQVAALDVEQVSFGVSIAESLNGAMPLASVPIASLVQSTPDADLPPLAVNDRVAYTRNATEILIPLQVLLGNDFDPDENSSFEIGALSAPPGVVIAGFDASVGGFLPEVPPDYAADFPFGLIRLELPASLASAVQFTYQLTSLGPDAAQSNVATVTVVPEAVPIVAQGDGPITATIGQFGPLMANQVLANDSGIGLRIIGMLDDSGTPGDPTDDVILPSLTTANGTTINLLDLGPGPNPGDGPVQYFNIAPYGSAAGESPSYVGSDQFTYVVQDENGDRSQATVTLAITNVRPFANDDLFQFRPTAAQPSLFIPLARVLSNDGEVDGSPVYLGGYVAQNTTDGGRLDRVTDAATEQIIYGFRYTPPDPAFTGTESFQFDLYDRDAGTLSGHARAYVRIRVGDLPATDLALRVRSPSGTAVDGGSVAAVQGTVFSLGLQVENQGSDVSNAEVTLRIPSTIDLVSVDSAGADIHRVGDAIVWNTGDVAPGAVALASISIRANTLGSFMLTPEITRSGPGVDQDSVPNNGYVLGEDDAVSFTLQVAPGSANRPPVVVADGLRVTRLGQPLAISASVLLANDTDPDGDPLSVSSFESHTAQGGTITFDSSTDTFTYTPPAAFTGADVFTYVVSDGVGGFTAASLTLNVVVNRAPVVTPDPPYSVHWGQPLDISASSLLKNDTDPDGDQLFISFFQSQTAQGGNVAVLSANTLDSFRYTPPARFVGQDTFTYTVSDKFGGNTTATLKINVENRAPEFSHVQSVTILEGAPWSVVAKATDPDGDPLTMSLVQAPSGAIFDPSTGLIRWTSPVGVYTGPMRAFFVVRASDGVDFDDEVFNVTVYPDLLRVTSFNRTLSGFKVRFNRPYDSSVVNLYDGQGPTGPAGLGGADVTLLDTLWLLPEAASLVPDADQRGFTFIRSGLTPPNGNFIATLVSGTNGLRDLYGRPLDGDHDFVAGGNYVASLLAQPLGPRLSIADFMRGPGQDVNLPATGTGVPIRLLSSAASTVSFELTYNAALLKITDVSAPRGATIVRTVLGQGHWRIDVSGLNLVLGPNLPATGDEVVRLIANVPASAPYGAKAILDLSNVKVNGSYGAYDDDGLEVVGYIGDTSGNAKYSLLDVTRLQRVISGLDKGFAAYPLVDPRIVGNVDGDITITSLTSRDVTWLLETVLGARIPAIPPLPRVTPTIVFSGLDPALKVGDAVVSPGSRLSVPLSIDNAAGLDSAQFTLGYDPAMLTFVGARTTSLTAGFMLQVDGSQAGQVRVDMATTLPLTSGAGPVIQFDFMVRPSAPAQSTLLDLQSARLNDGAFLLTPSPNSGQDETDGWVRVLGAGPGTRVRGHVVDSLRTAFEKRGGHLGRHDTTWFREFRLAPLDAGGLRATMTRR